MWDRFPFLSYDLIARIIPGGFTLAVMMKFFPRWFSSFNGSDAWKAVVMPVGIAGLSYLIGVVYEALYSFPFLRQRLSNRAFREARAGFEKTLMTCTSVSRPKRFTSDEHWRNYLWQKLLFESAQKAEMVTIFSHCHRFQAEYKMFYHLMLPALLFAAGSVIRKEYGMAIVGVGLLGLFWWCAARREERRWWYVLGFAEQLNWLGENKSLSYWW
jgi:hypothetical protein